MSSPSSKITSEMPINDIDAYAAVMFHTLHHECNNNNCVICECKSAMIEHITIPEMAKSIMTQIYYLKCCIDKFTEGYFIMPAKSVEKCVDKAKSSSIIRRI